MPRFIAGLALIAVFAIAGCGAPPIYSESDLVLYTVAAIAGSREARMCSPSDIAFSEPPTTVQKVLTLEDYKNAIIRGGGKRGWTFEDGGPGHLIGSVAVRNKHFATVDVLFDTDAFTILYKSSQNLDYDASRNVIHKNYNAWIHNLEGEIQAEITQMKVV
ncbi:MAG TPA: hypothetical protein VMY41_11980 [Thermohalobaculum sp.]|nr:hypothetical protein [Thermohalobaculum sp.]